MFWPDATASGRSFLGAGMTDGYGNRLALVVQLLGLLAAARLV